MFCINQSIHYYVSSAEMQECSQTEFGFSDDCDEILEIPRRRKAMKHVLESNLWKAYFPNATRVNLRSEK